LPFKSWIWAVPVLYLVLTWPDTSAQKGDVMKKGEEAYQKRIKILDDKMKAGGH